MYLKKWPNKHPQLSDLFYHVKISSNGVRTYQAVLNLKVTVILLKIFIIFTISREAID